MSADFGHDDAMRRGTVFERPFVPSPLDAASTLLKVAYCLAVFCLVVAGLWTLLPVVLAFHAVRDAFREGPDPLSSLR